MRSGTGFQMASETAPSTDGWTSQSKVKSVEAKGAADWNIIPSKIKISNSVEMFKKGKCRILRTGGLILGRVERTLLPDSGKFCKKLKYSGGKKITYGEKLERKYIYIRY